MRNTQVLGAALLLSSALVRAQQPDGCAAVLSAANGFTNGGGYTSKPSPLGGAPEKILFKGETIRERSRNGTYCSGFTFAVVMKAASQRGLLKERTIAQIRDFEKIWYGADVAKTDWEKQCVLALTELKIGKELPWKESKPGDFMQIYRSDTPGETIGHSVVFLGGVTENGKILGIKFRSSQTKTDGIGNAKAYFNGANVSNALETFGYEISAKRIYAGRLNWAKGLPQMR
jgi:hypothetical protein